MAVTTEKINNFVFLLIVLEFASTKSILNAAGLHFCACLFSKVLLGFFLAFFSSRVQVLSVISVYRHYTGQQFFRKISASEIKCAASY